MVAGLRNIDDELAETVAEGPRPARDARAAQPAREPRRTCRLAGAEHPRERPGSFAGRKIGVLVTDGVDAGLLAALRSAAAAEEAMLELVAPEVGGTDASDGSTLAATRSSTAARRSSSTPSRSSPRPRAPPRWPPARRPATSSPTRSRTASSSPTPAAPRRCWKRPACGATPRPTADSSASTTTSRPISSPDAASCGSGTACRPPLADGGLECPVPWH